MLLVLVYLRLQVSTSQDLLLFAYNPQFGVNTIISYYYTYYPIPPQFENDLSPHKRFGSASVLIPNAWKHMSRDNSCTLGMRVPV